MKNFKLLAIVATLLFTALASSAWARKVIIEAKNQTISDATTWEDVTIIFAGDGSVTYSSRITISGSVKLDIGEGSTLVVPKGIEVDEDNTLTIVGNGALNASADKFYAAIGSGYYDDVSRTSGTINIKSGKITATGGQFAAGIGGGANGGCGEINISGGQVTAIAGENAAGIGGGANGGTSGIVTLDWTNEDDFIYASSYKNVSSVSFTDGKYFYWDENGVNQLATKDNIDGKILHPLDVANSTYAQDIGKASISGMKRAYNYTGSVIPLNYSVYSNIDNELLTKGTDYTETITRDGVETEVREEGYYTLTITGKDPYFDSRSFNFRVQNHTPSLKQDGNDWYMNMPYSGTSTLTLDGSISTFMIYDDGGKGGDYDQNTAGNFTPGTNGYLLIHAPSGYQVHLMGYVRTKSENAYLTIYDGSSELASTLAEKIHGKFISEFADSYYKVVVDVTSSGEEVLLHFDASEEVWNSEGLILTATFAPIAYDITYNGVDGATFATANPATYTIESANITLNNPSKNGYEFAGWYDNVKFEGSAITGVAIPTGSSGTKAFYAKWKKLLTNTEISIADISDQTYTGSKIEPEVTVTDGETSLTLGTDYTVSYSANTNAGTATVTITGMGNYGGELVKTFKIVKADPTIVKAPVAVENLVYNGKAQTLVTAGEAKNGVMVYKLEGAEKYSETLPTATKVGEYTVYFMVKGDDNYNDLKAQKLTVSIEAASSSSVEIASSSSNEKKDGFIPVVASGLKVQFVRNELTVTAPTASEVKVYVFDLQGNLKKQYHGQSASTHFVSLNQMNRGLYLVRVISGGNVRTLRAQVK